MAQVVSVTRRPASKGFSIAVYGPDGAGKSTVMDWIAEDLAEGFNGRVRRSHIRPDRLPRGAKIKAALGLAKPRKDTEEQARTVFRDPYSSPMPGRLKSLGRLSWFFADFAFDGLVKIWPTRELRLYDRFVDDYLIDSRRHRLNLPHWFLTAVLKPIPRPDLTILLVGDPARIAARKGEQTPEEAKRQIDVLKDMAQRMPRSHLLPTDCSMDETRAKLRDILTTFGPALTS